MALVLGANGGGAIVIMLSVTSFYTNPLDASYGASKAAEWSWTDSIRVELAHQGPLVGAEHASFIDTDMAAGIDIAKISPESVATRPSTRSKPGHVEVLADERSPVCQGLGMSRSRTHLSSSIRSQAFRDSLTRGSR